MNTELIIFDFDGTLGDTRRNIVTTMQMTIRELQLPCRSDDVCASTIGLPLEGCFQTLFPQVTRDVILRCTDTYRRIFQENLVTMKPRLFPHVADTLAILKHWGCLLTIASSRWHKSLLELTHDLGIADCFVYLVGADDVQKAKPYPEPVLKTLSMLDVEASHTIVVGDMDVDILMGAKAGTKTCGVTYGNGTRAQLEEAGADYIIDGIDELLNIVNSKKIG